MARQPDTRDDQYPPEEAARRRDDALRRALNMPAAPQEAMKVGKRETEPKDATRRTAKRRAKKRE